MADVQPFKALHYDLGKVGSLDAVAAPPYDVIDAAGRARAAGALALQRGRDRPAEAVRPGRPGERPEGDPYEGAARTIDAWRAEGALVARRGALDLGPDPGLHRARRQQPQPPRRSSPGSGSSTTTKACARTSAPTPARSGPAAADPRRPATTSRRSSRSAPRTPGRWSSRRSRPSPGARSPTTTGTVNRVWQVTDPEVHAAVSERLAGAELLIADGHHRYETARAFRDEVGGEGPHNYTLMALTGLDDPGLTVFPTHRLLSGFADDPERQRRLGSGLRELFEIERDRPRGDRPGRRGGRRRLRPLRRLPQAGLPTAPQGHRRARPPPRRQARGLPPARLGDPRDAGPQGPGRDERRRHRRARRARIREERPRRAGDGRRRRLRRRLHPAPGPGRAGPRRRRDRGEHAAEVDLLLPQGDDRVRLQPGRAERAPRRIGPWSRSTPRRATTGPPRSGTAAASPSTTAAPSAYGTLDEACSQLGVARALCGAEQAELAADILRLQDDLFVAGAELATAPEAAERLEDGVSRTTEAMVAELERLIDHYMAQVELPPKFVIPGGNQLSAQLDVARTVGPPRRAPHLRPRRGGRDRAARP